MTGSTTKLTTVRIPRELYDVISTDANNEEIGFNTILNRILRKYVEWDKPTKGFDMMSVSRAGFVAILNSTNGSELKQASMESQKVLKELAEFFEVAHGKDMLGFLSVLCKYGGFGTLATKNGSETTIHFRHGLGRKVSSFFASFLKSFSKEIVQLLEQDNSITIIAKFRKKAGGR